MTRWTPNHPSTDHPHTDTTVTTMSPGRPAGWTTPKGTPVMHHLAATLHTLGIRLRRAAATRAERGSVTIEQVLWAVAVIAIVGIVVLAVTNYVTSEAAKIT